MSRRSLNLVALVVSILGTGASSLGAGRYELAWWREWGMYENGGPGGGNHSIHVWVFDENGVMKSGVDLYTSWGVLQGTTNSEGRCEIVLYTDHDRDVRVGAPGAVDSEVTPIMTTARWPNWGHYSYDCGFMYKADSASPGDFDTSVLGTVNLRDGSETDCPYTSSLVYNSIDYRDTYSDAFALGHWSSSFAQTFQATSVDRIMGVMLQGTIGGNTPLTWTAEIREGGPTGPVVFSKSTPFDVYPFRYFIPFGITNCPVVAGQTYAVILTRPGGCNTYHVANVYSNGQYYEVTTPYPGNDLVGFVLGMRYQQPGTGSISGTVRNAAGQPLRGATVTTSPGSYTATTGAEGRYYLWNVPAGTYAVTASKNGYAPQTRTGQTVTAGSTTTVDFTLASTRGTISGQIQAAEGGPIEGALVRTDPGGYAGVTGDDGGYEIINVPPGTYTVRAAAPARAETSQAGKVVTAANTTVVNLTLARSGRVAHRLDDFNGNYALVGSNDYLEESFRMGFDNHQFIRATSADRIRSPHVGTDSAQQISVSENNDQFVSYFESKDPLTGEKDFNLVQYAASRGWEPIDLAQPITYLVYVKGFNDALNPTDPAAYWRQTLGIHRPAMYGGKSEIQWNEDNNATWQVLKADVTGLLDNEKQWITFETWYPAYYGSMIYLQSWMVWENLTVEYTPLITLYPGDFDDDHDVDQVDFGCFQACLTGPDGSLASGCGQADLDRDTDADGEDFILFQGCLSGPGVESDPGCAG